MLIEQIQSRIYYYKNKIAELREAAKKALELAQDLRDIIPKLSNVKGHFESTVNRNCDKIQSLASLGIGPTLIDEFCETLRGGKYYSVIGALETVSGQASLTANEKETEANDAQEEERHTQNLLYGAQRELSAAMEAAAAALQSAVESGGAQ